MRYADWLQVDDAYAAQMAYKADLMMNRRATVTCMQDGCLPAAQELLEVALANRPAEFSGARAITCPDGRKVDPNLQAPFDTLAVLFQEDFVILQKQDDAHILTAALLCFPASWSLSEKFGRPLTEIHDPVPDYDAGVARSVERMFSAIRVDQPLTRSNALVYADPDLHHPHRGSDRLREQGQTGYIRSERQCMVRLPRTGAVVFSIHTYLVRAADLTAEQAAGLRAHPIVHAKGQP